MAQKRRENENDNDNNNNNGSNNNSETIVNITTNPKSRINLLPFIESLCQHDPCNPAVLGRCLVSCQLRILARGEGRGRQREKGEGRGERGRSEGGERDDRWGLREKGDRGEGREGGEKGRGL